MKKVLLLQKIIFAVTLLAATGELYAMAMDRRDIGDISVIFAIISVIILPCTLKYEQKHSTDNPL